MSERKCLGRRKIRMEKIENETTRLVTFSKRKSGLYKKASKLVEKYDDVNLGIISYSPNGKPYSFFHPTFDSVVGHFEYIDTVNEEDVKRLEEWLDLVDLKLNHKLMMLENGVASSTQAPPDNAYQAYSGF
ncbi:hypothetical protein BC332_22940 [Capsicum chinense]|nr:hypothetical protein BC332_22940 [Capsicum chinense]